MAPTKNPKRAKRAAAKKPTALAPKTEGNRVSRKPKVQAKPQRSSLRKAIERSLLDLEAMATSRTPDSIQASSSATTATSPSPVMMLPTLLDGSGNPSAPQGLGQIRRVGVTYKTPSTGVASSRKGWHDVRSIGAEIRCADGTIRYLVGWEGVDTRTGQAWPDSWVEEKNVSKAAIHEWKNSLKTKAGAKEKAKL
ncbi:hypothetical protein M426DRAFT_117046 [Hypoxylon sp. CI-4A]|nr:hypothetical protein M426DRAFT_117046 [Hypoxylon sp. CI-4A]